MTDERLAELERLEQAAMPGPWTWCGADLYPDAGVEDERFAHQRLQRHDGVRITVLERGFVIDLLLIVAARNALPELLAEVRRLQACREALRICLAEYVEEYGSASCDCEEPDCWVCKSVEALKATE